MITHKSSLDMLMIAPFSTGNVTVPRDLATLGPVDRAGRFHRTAVELPFVGGMPYCEIRVPGRPGRQGGRSLRPSPRSERCGAGRPQRLVVWLRPSALSSMESPSRRGFAFL